jgi:hypothetical protein
MRKGSRPFSPSALAAAFVNDREGHEVSLLFQCFKRCSVKGYRRGTEPFERLSAIMGT